MMVDFLYQNLQNQDLEIEAKRSTSVRPLGPLGSLRIFEMLKDMGGT